MVLYSVLFLTQKNQITTMSTNAEMAVKKWLSNIYTDTYAHK